MTELRPLLNYTNLDQSFRFLKVNTIANKTFAELLSVRLVRKGLYGEHQEKSLTLCLCLVELFLDCRARGPVAVTHAAPIFCGTRVDLPVTPHVLHVQKVAPTSAMWVRKSVKGKVMNFVKWHCHLLNDTDSDSETSTPGHNFVLVGMRIPWKYLKTGKRLKLGLDSVVRFV